MNVLIDVKRSDGARSEITEPSRRTEPGSRPPLITPGSVILFQGDSITDAFRRPDEVNNAYQLGSGYALMVSSQLLHRRPADRLQFLNRGVSGDTLARLTARWPSDTLALRPQLLSLLVGINDTAHEAAGSEACSPAQFERDGRALLTLTRQALPDVQLVLCEPFALPCGMVTDHWQQPLARRQRIIAALAREFSAVFVPLQDAFTAAARGSSAAYWLYDGIHPTAPGHALIAHAWLQATEPGGL